MLIEKQKEREMSRIRTSHNSICILVTLLLLGCSDMPPSQQLETATPTPMPTATSSPTLVPTNTPVATYNDAQDFFGNEFEITNDGRVIDKTIGKEVPGFTIIPFDENMMIKPYKSETSWAWQRTYEFMDKKEFIVTGTKDDIKILPKSGIDMYGWIYETGEFKRQKIEFDTYGSPQKIQLDGYSSEEAQYLIMTNSTSNPTHQILPYRRILIEMYQTLRPQFIVEEGVVRLYSRYSGIYQKMLFYGNCGPWGGNIIVTRNADNSWSKSLTSTFWVVPTEDRKRAFVLWFDSNDNKTLIPIEGFALDYPKYFNKHWSTDDIKTAC